MALNKDKNRRVWLTQTVVAVELIMKVFGMGIIVTVPVSPVHR